MALLTMAFCPSTQQPAADAFKGDAEHYIDRLVVASQKKQVDESLLQERALIPFFEPSDSANTTFEPLERRKPAPQQPHHGLKRNAGERSGANLASSPPKSVGKDIPAAKHRRGGKPAPHRSGSGSHSDSELSSTSVPRPVVAAPSAPAGQRKKHTRQVDNPPAGDTRRSPSPPHKRSEHVPPRDSSSPPPRFFGAASKFAGPAFCNSPTPDCLPIPTLLMQQAADSLRSRLTL